MKRLLCKEGVLAAMAAALLIPTVAVNAWDRVDNRAAKQISAEQLRENSRKLKEGRPDGSSRHQDKRLGVSELPARIGAATGTINHLTRSAEEPRADFYAMVPITKTMVTADQAFLGKIDGTTGNFQKIFSGSHFRSGDYEYMSAAIRGNYLYLPCLDATVFETVVYWNEIDLNTGELVRRIDFGSDALGAPYTLAYDEKSDKFYGLATNGSSYNQLLVYDPQTFKFDYIADLSNKPYISAIAYYPEDQSIYGFDCTNRVYIIDSSRGQVDQAGELSTENDMTIYEEGFNAPICYSPKDHCFVTILGDSNIEKYVLNYIDPESWEVSRGQVINDNYGSYFGAMVCTDLYAAWEAPELPVISDTKFEGSSTSGSVTFKASALQFSGIAFASGVKLKTVATLDGKTIFEGELNPGEEKTIDVTTESGEHTMSVYCEANGEKSPVASKIFYTGYDNPYPVTNLKLNDLELTWTAPKKGGVHNGYVDDSVLYYDVYFNNEKINSRPVTTTSYTIYHPAEMAMTAISVVAVSNGMESSKTTLDEIIGKAKTLPVSIEPTLEELSIIKIVDANNDNESFNYSKYNDIDHGLLRHQIGYFNDADEWVFLPRTSFPDADKLYNLTLAIGGIYTGTTREDLSIYIGKKAEPSAMTELIWNRYQLGCPHVPVEHSINFAVPEAGEYYIGIHYNSQKDLNGRGITLSLFNVKQTDSTADVPAAVTACEIKGDPSGSLQADLTLTLPTKNIKGELLPADKDLTVAVECDGLDDYVTKTGKPGEQVVVRSNAAKDGFNQFVITVGNDNGYGPSISYRGYVGLDTPYAPTNLILNPKGDNTSATLSWDAPPAIGLNGGYVNLDGIEYVVYYRTATSAVNLKKFGTSNTTSFDFTVPPYAYQQEYYMMTVGAQNSTGYDSNMNFTGDILGKPYNLPMVEEYGTSRFDYYPVMRRTGAGYGGITLENEKDLSAYAPYLGGNPTLRSGGLIMYADAGAAKSQIMIPKASTKGIPEVQFSAALWDYANAPHIYLTGRTSADPQKIIELGDLPLAKTNSPEWNEEAIVLPKEFSNQDWIQLYINVDFTANPAEFLVIDRYSIKPNVEYDLQIYDLAAPPSTNVGETITVTTTIANSGLETNSGRMTVSLYDPEGNRLATELGQLPRLLSGRTATTSHEFNIAAEWGDFEYITVRASIEGMEDMVETNNTEELNIRILNTPLPVVNDLAGAYNDDHTAVTLTWSEPDLSHGDNEDMEHTRPFLVTDQIGLFRNVDLDNSECFEIDGLTWPDADKPQAWTVMNAKELGLMNDTRLYPHSGEQYLMARALHYDFMGGETPKQADDWLISPEVVPGTEVTFWYNRLNTEYTEYVELWVSSTDDELGDEVVTNASGQRVSCGSFRKVRSFSKTGSETWEEVTFTLPSDAKYFALVYCSFDSFGAMIDDIQFTPKQLAKWEVDHYSVFRHVTKDGKTVVEDLDNNVKGTSLTKEVEDANANYYVRTFVQTPVGVKYGPLSNQLRLYAMGVDDLTDLQGVYGTEGAIIVKGHAGEKFALYTADGKYLRHLTLTEANQTVAAEPGICIVKAGNAMVKVLVK